MSDQTDAADRTTAASSPVPRLLSNHARPNRALSSTAIRIGAIVVVAIAMASVWTLLALFGSGTPADATRLDAVRTASTIVLGTGGGIALYLAARRQRSTEIDLLQKERAQHHTEQDSAARRITELYTAAADQLGSEKAPVRLAGLYALERLAQDNPAQRQTIVNVLCAYLRMPFELPAPPDDAASAADDCTGELTERRDWQQEREVRLTAQRILTEHLHCNNDSDSLISPTFWFDIDLDLTGAALIDFTAERCRARRVNFTGANFSGYANFTGANFSGDVCFDQASFDGGVSFYEGSFDGIVSFIAAGISGYARFEWASFRHAAVFDGASFGAGEARFNGANFSYHTSFQWASFRGPAIFERAGFCENVIFDEANFGDYARFGWASFGGSGSFIAADFGGPALFAEASFDGPAVFDGAGFRGPAIFKRTKFTDHTRFQGAEFSGGHVPLEVTRFVAGEESLGSSG